MMRSVQFSSVQSLSRARLFATPLIAARQASLSITNSRSSLALWAVAFSPFFIKPGIEGPPPPWCSPQPPVILPHLMTFAPLFFPRRLNISPPLLPHGSLSSAWSLLDWNVLLPPGCPAITASHVPIHPGPATHPSVSLWVGVSSPPLRPGASFFF